MAGELVVTPSTPIPGGSTGSEGSSTGDTTTTEPSGSESEATDTETSSTDDSTIVGTDGNVITKIPQTGAPVYLGVIALVAIAGSVLVVRKIRK